MKKATKTEEKKRVTITCSKKEPKMVSYSLKMTIPTGPYANIIPEIVVNADNMEQAYLFIAPHLNKLWKEYYMISERVNKPIAPQDVKMLPNEQQIVSNSQVTESPINSVAFNRATQAINSCTNKEALDLIADRVEKSVKLTPEDKDILKPIIKDKYGEFQPTE